MRKSVTQCLSKNEQQQSGPYVVCPADIQRGQIQMPAPVECDKTFVPFVVSIVSSKTQHETLSDDPREIKKFVYSKTNYYLGSAKMVLEGGF